MRVGRSVGLESGPQGEGGKANQDTEEELPGQILGSTSEDDCARVRCKYSKPR